MSTVKRILHVVDWSNRLIPYSKALKIQESQAELCKQRLIHDTIILLQHPPTYTIGKRGSLEADFKVPPVVIVERGAEIHHIPRGGETTFHGPGQLVAYPILNLRRLGIGARAYVEGLEDVVIATLHHFGIPAQGRLPGLTGVWTGDKKICAIGVKISHGITSHGLALNFSTDLEYFQSIVPCGVLDKGVTSMLQQMTHKGSLDDTKLRLLDNFALKFKPDNIITSCHIQAASLTPP